MIPLRPGWEVRITGDPVAELQTLSVMPQGRGRGTGAALMRAVDGRLRGRGGRRRPGAGRAAPAGAARQPRRVMPRGRGRGAGAALMRAVDDRLREAGVRELTVGVSTAN